MRQPAEWGLVAEAEGRSLHLYWSGINWTRNPRSIRWMTKDAAVRRLQIVGVPKPGDGHWRITTLVRKGEV